MWRPLWPGAETTEVPIIPITNGVDTRTWLCAEMAELYDRYLGEGWRRDASLQTLWDGVDKIPDPELWHTHERRRERLVAFIRRREGARRQRRAASDVEQEAAQELLDPSALTIGFARRFATYKRATLILRQPERLRALLTNKERPIQIIFAGKAHPKDHPGKELIRSLVHFGRDPELRRRLVFVEEYDMGVARRLVQGVDVWLNTPRRPKEASGTSGMKVVPNGGLNMSVLDGWWAEAYDGANGWAIGAGELYDDTEMADHIEAELLLSLLEDQLVPEFYDRGPDGLPRAWIKRMKHSMRGLSGRFSTDRMLKDYTQELYLPATKEVETIQVDDYATVRDRAELVSRIRAAWEVVKVGEVSVTARDEVTLGSDIAVNAWVHLGALAPSDVITELYGGTISRESAICSGQHAPMTLAEAGQDGWYKYEGKWSADRVGRTGLTVRVRPRLARAAPVLGFAIKSWQ